MPRKKDVAGNGQLAVFEEEESRVGFGEGERVEGSIQGRGQRTAEDEEGREGGLFGASPRHC